MTLMRAVPLVLLLALSAPAAVPAHEPPGAPPHAPKKSCAEARRTGGWCEAEKAGYLAGVKIRSHQLYETLDAHGHPVERSAVTCATCLRAMETDGFCPAHRMGYVGSLAYLSPLTWHLARSRDIDPAALTCPTCRKNSKAGGWCDLHKVGIAGRVAIDDRRRFDDFLEARRILIAAVELSATCENCAAAMVADGYCAIHHLKYQDGRASPQP